jgi:hypothetical protein
MMWLLFATNLSQGNDHDVRLLNIGGGNKQSHTFLMYFKVGACGASTCALQLKRYCCQWVLANLHVWALHVGTCIMSAGVFLSKSARTVCVYACRGTLRG